MQLLGHEMTIVIVIVMLKAFSKCYVIVRVWEGGGGLKGVICRLQLQKCATFLCYFFWQFNRFRFQIRFHFGGGKGKSRRHVDLCVCLRPVWTATPTEAALRFLKRRTTSTNGENRTRRCCCCYWLYWLLHSVTICMQIDL